MLRWIRKRCKRTTDLSEKKDEYGFDTRTSRQPSLLTIEHIYEEIPEAPSWTSCFTEREPKPKRPELPPRNTPGSLRQTGTYSQWRSQRAASLPELRGEMPLESGLSVDDVDDDGDNDHVIGSEQFTQEFHEFLFDLPHNTSNRTRKPEVTDLRQFSNISSESKCASLRRNDLRKSNVRNYLPVESDSGYDYSGSSSNGSDVNDSGLSDSYEYHLSKVEQICCLEKEIQSLKCDSVSSLRRDVLLNSHGANKSQLSLSNLSMTSDLDLDDEILAFTDRIIANSDSEFKPPKRHSNVKSYTPRPVVRNQTPFRHHNVKDASCEKTQIPATTSTSLRQSVTPQTKRCVKLGEEQRNKTNSFHRKSSGNRLLGDLIRINNDHLFFK